METVSSLVLVLISSTLILADFAHVSADNVSTTFPPCKCPPPFTIRAPSGQCVDPTPLSPSPVASGTEQGLGNNSWLDLASHSSPDQGRVHMRRPELPPAQPDMPLNELFLTSWATDPVKIQEEKCRGPLHTTCGIQFQEFVELGRTD